MSYQLPLPFPRPEEARITYDAASSNIVVSNTTRVGRHNFYTFTVGGRVVGKVDAEFEFKDLPPELHMTAANMIPPVRRAKPRPCTAAISISDGRLTIPSLNNNAPAPAMAAMQRSRTSPSDSVRGRIPFEVRSASAIARTSEDSTPGLPGWL